MKEILSVIGIIIGAIIIIAVFKNWNRIFPPSETKPELPSEDEVKCELKDANTGNIITITGNANDQNFQRMCQNKTNQPIYLYNYPYYFIRYWRPMHHPNPPPPPPAP